jgi:hypothetical protein
MSSALSISLIILFTATECSPAKALIEESAIFFSKEGSTSHTLRYSNFMIEYNLDEVETNINKIRDALCKYHKDIGGGCVPLNMYHKRKTSNFVGDPTMHAVEINRHRFNYIFTAHLQRLTKFRGLIENQALAHPTESRNFYFGGKRPSGKSSRAQQKLFHYDNHDPSYLDGNDDPAPDPIAWYHCKQGKHNAFSGIMMIRKKRSKLPSFDDIFNANYRLYPTIADYKRAPPPTTPWTELILEGLNLNPRKTRGIVLTIIAIAALVAASAATIGGLYLAEELEQHKCREELYAGISSLTLDGVAQLSGTQEELNRITQEVITSLESEYATYYTSEHVNLLLTAINRRMEVINSAFQCAMDQKISVLSFTELHFACTAMKGERDARQAGLIPVSKHFSDYLQYPASFIKSKTGFTVMVHVPLIDPDSAMTLYMHQTLPIPLRDHLYLHLGPSDYTHLAVSADGKFFRTMPLAQFNTCCTIREFYLCDCGLVVRKSPDKDAIPPVHKDPELCIFALFQRRFELAKTLIGVQTTAMQMVGPNVIASYAADPHQGTITCEGDSNPSGPPITTFTVASALQITLPFGCVAETDTHVFAAADNYFSQDVHEYLVAYTWPFDVHDLTHGLDTKALRGLMDRFGNLNNCTHHNMPLKKALAAVKEDKLLHPVYHNLIHSNQHNTTWSPYWQSSLSASPSLSASSLSTGDVSGTICDPTSDRASGRLNN